MKADDRRLCYEFLVQIGRRSKSGAKAYFEVLGESRRSQLLEHASEWNAMGRPTRNSVPLSVPDERIEREQPSRVIESPPEQVSVGRSRKKLFSLMLAPEDLAELRALSEATGEAVAYHVREAVRRYLGGVRKSV